MPSPPKVSKVFYLNFPALSFSAIFDARPPRTLLKKKAPKDEHLTFYTDWVSSEMEKLREILKDLPSLSKELSLHNNVLFTVLHGYGMGSLAVCHFHDQKVHWEMPADRVPH